MPTRKNFKEIALRLERNVEALKDMVSSGDSVMSDQKIELNKLYSDYDRVVKERNEIESNLYALNRESNDRKTAFRKALDIAENMSIFVREITYEKINQVPLPTTDNVEVAKTSNDLIFNEVDEEKEPDPDAKCS